MITKEYIKELTEKELKLCYNEYRKRMREVNKDAIKKTNNKHYIKRTLKKKDINLDNILKSKRTLNPKEGDLNIFN